MPAGPNSCLDEARTRPAGLSGERRPDYRAPGRAFQRRPAPAPDFCERGAVSPVLRLERRTPFCVSTSISATEPTASWRAAAAESSAANRQYRGPEQRIFGKPVDLQRGRERRRLPDDREHAASHVRERGQRNRPAVGRNVTMIEQPAPGTAPSHSARQLSAWNCSAAVLGAGCDAMQRPPSAG